MKYSLSKNQNISYCIEDALDHHFDQITKIYHYYVMHTLITLEEIPPNINEMKRRWRDLIGHGLPYLVAKDQDRIIGYAYAQPYRSRSAYIYSIEDSVYIHPDYISRGIGSALLSQLIHVSKQWGYRQMVAVISHPSNESSIALHKKYGFEQSGLLKNIGFKKGYSINTLIMQMCLNDSYIVPPTINVINKK